jgi:hypothetical protein
LKELFPLKAFSESYFIRRFCHSLIFGLLH